MQSLRSLDGESTSLGSITLGQSLCRVVRDLAAQGWCQGTGGNFSATLSREPLRLLITRSGLHKRHLEPDGLMIVGPGGKAAEGETARPSAEAALHAVIVERTGAASVLHVHSVANTLLGEHFADRGGFTLRGYEMLKGLEGVTTHEAEAFVPVLRNSQDMTALAGEVDRLLARHPGAHGFLLSGHGLYTWGASLDQAHRHVEILEFLFECVARRTDFKHYIG
ncbi:MAG: methylthioribulose-phosphate dehydratase [Acidobacteriota bacterium]|jgi:methylthioribulose-1-phosphate dehydratase|nr:methylthioribulose-phosphate dehydratase [Acidobacteriota bacterium]